MDWRSRSRISQRLLEIPAEVAAAHIKVAAAEITAAIVAAVAASGMDSGVARVITRVVARVITLVVPLLIALLITSIVAVGIVGARVKALVVSLVVAAVAPTVEAREQRVEHEHRSDAPCPSHQSRFPPRLRVVPSRNRPAGNIATGMVVGRIRTSGWRGPIIAALHMQRQGFANGAGLALPVQRWHRRTWVDTHRGAGGSDIRQAFERRLARVPRTEPWSAPYAAGLRRRCTARSRPPAPAVRPCRR